MKIHDVGKLAARAEGQFWNIYWTEHDGTMTLVASLRMPLASQSRELRANFLELVQGAVAEAIRTLTGDLPVWTDAEPEDRNREGSA